MTQQALVENPDGTLSTDQADGTQPASAPAQAPATADAPANPDQAPPKVTITMSGSVKEAVLKTGKEALEVLTSTVALVQDAEATDDKSDTQLPEAVGKAFQRVKEMLSGIGGHSGPTAKLLEVASQALLASNSIDLDKGVDALKKMVAALTEVAKELEAPMVEPAPETVESIDASEDRTALAGLLRQISDRAGKAAEIYGSQTATSKSAVASEVSELLGLAKAVEEVSLEKADPGKRLAAAVRSVAERATALANALSKTGVSPNARNLRAVKTLLATLERALKRYPTTKSDGIEDPMLPEGVLKAAGTIARILRDIATRGTALATKIEGKENGPTVTQTRGVARMIRMLRGLVDKYPSLKSQKGDDDDDTPAAAQPAAADADAQAPKPEGQAADAAAADAPAAQADPPAAQGSGDAGAADAPATQDGGADVEKKLEAKIAKAVESAVSSVVTDLKKDHETEVAALKAEVASLKKGVTPPASKPDATPSSDGAPKRGTVPTELQFPQDYNDPSYREELEKRNIAF